MYTPCNKTPDLDCCKVMECIDIQSSDNSITVEKSECGVDLTFSPNNIDNLLQINDGECIKFVKEFISGKLVITPQIDWDCVIGKISQDICNICQPAPCPAPLGLQVIITP